MTTEKIPESFRLDLERLTNEIISVYRKRIAEMISDKSRPVDLLNYSRGFSYSVATTLLINVMSDLEHNIYGYQPLEDFYLFVKGFGEHVGNVFKTATTVAFEPARTSELN